MLVQHKQAIRNFTEQYIVPQEPALLQGDELVLNALSRQARELGLWGQFYPLSMGGKTASWLEYQTLAEEEGRSEWGPAVFGTQALLDIHLLSRFGPSELQTTWLPPLIRGDIVGAYGMSEPQSIGSVPATITTQARLQDGYWVIDGGKWFVSRAQRAAFMVVIAKTDEHAPPEHAFSMLLVPIQAQGVHRGQDVRLLGRDLGQAELTFQAVKVPQHHVIGQPGLALMLMQERLKLGRLMNASHWIGLAQRCFDDMCQRIASARGQQARLSSKQLVRQHVFNVYQAIGGARAHAKQAAEALHHGLDRLVDIHVAKVSASQALSLAVDSAVQIFGAEGLNDAHVLSSIYRLARTTRILDGADEVLINAVGRDLLKMHGLDAEHV